MDERLLWLGAFGVIVAGLAALLLWSGGPRPSWGDNDDDPDTFGRRRKKTDDHDDADVVDGDDS